MNPDFVGDDFGVAPDAGADGVIEAPEREHAVDGQRISVLFECEGSIDVQLLALDGHPAGRLITPLA